MCLIKSQEHDFRQNRSVTTLNENKYFRLRKLKRLIIVSHLGFNPPDMKVASSAHKFGVHCFIVKVKGTHALR